MFISSSGCKGKKLFAIYTILLRFFI
jgi:hypothetical protein